MNTANHHSAKTEHVDSNLLLSAPHIHSGMTVNKLMQQVILALLPILLFGVFLFGLKALLLILAAVCSAIITEYLCHVVQKHPLGHLSDGSAILTALLLVASLPPHFPWYLGALGASIAVIFGKQVYGGLGQNIFNPAMLARVVLLISFPVEMTSWPSPEPILPIASIQAILPAADAITGATLLAGIMETGSNEISLDFITMLLGANSGSLGESPILLLIAGLWMSFKKVIDWRIALSLLIGCMLPTSLMWLISPESLLAPQGHLLGGALLLTAFFIATDPVTSPASPKARLIYGALCGLLIFCIRVFGAYPEGAAFAILLMNAISPLIETYSKPRAYGEGKSLKHR